jgi:hypothetical protein
VHITCSNAHAAKNMQHTLRKGFEGPGDHQQSCSCQVTTWKRNSQARYAKGSLADAGHNCSNQTIILVLKHSTCTAPEQLPNQPHTTMSAVAAAVAALTAALLLPAAPAPQPAAPPGQT